MERFWSKADRRSPDECWHWTGHVGKNGYGTFWYEGKTVNVHRMAFFLTHGQWPDFEVDHTCHHEDLSCVSRYGMCMHRRCVNPDHLRDVDHGTNKRAQNRCFKGHPLLAEGADFIVIKGQNGNPVRTCLTCKAETAERRKQKGEKHRSDTCSRGHDVTNPEIGRIAPDGRRQCRICLNINAKDRAARARGGEPMLTLRERGLKGASKRWGGEH